MTGPTLRPKHSPVGVHGSGETGKGLVSLLTTSALPVSGRVVESLQGLQRSLSRDQGVSRCVHDIGSTNKPEEAGLNPCAIHSVPRRAPRLHEGEDIPDAGPPRSGISVTESSPRTDWSAVQPSRITYGPAGGNGVDSPVRQASPQASTVASDTCDPHGQRPQGMGEPYPADSSRLTLVDSPPVMAGGNIISITIPRGDSIHGCVNQWLGGSVRGLELGGDMGPQLSHKLARTAYSTDGSPDPAIQATQQDRPVHARQHDGGGILIAAIRDTFPLPPQASSPYSEAVRELNLTLLAQHIAGQANVLADMVPEWARSYRRSGH